MSRDAINDRAWQEFQQELAECLSEMDDNDSLIIHDRFSGVYVQFSGDGYGEPMLAEAVSNVYLPPDEALSYDQYLAMCELGWLDPEDNPDHGGNAGSFFVCDNCPGDYSRLAELAVRTMTDAECAARSQTAIAKAWAEYEGRGRDVQAGAYYPPAAYFVDDELVVAITDLGRQSFLTCFHEHFSRAHGIDPGRHASVGQRRLRYLQQLNWDEKGGMIRNLKRIRNV